MDIAVAIAAGIALMLVAGQINHLVISSSPNKRAQVTIGLYGFLFACLIVFPFTQDWANVGFYVLGIVLCLVGKKTSNRLARRKYDRVDFVVKGSLLEDSVSPELATKLADLEVRARAGKLEEQNKERINIDAKLSLEDFKDQ